MKNSIHDIQVLAPIDCGTTGVVALNHRLQERLVIASLAEITNLTSELKAKDETYQSWIIPAIARK